MSDQDQLPRKDNKKLPLILGAFAISTAVLLLISWILMLTQKDPAGINEDQTGSKYLLAETYASLAINVLAFICFCVVLFYAFKINHTAPGKYDEQIWKYALIGFVSSGLSLIFIAVMTAGLHAVHTQNFNTGIGESMMNSYSVFASFFTLFIAGGTVFSILSGIITIRRSYKIKVEVAVDKTTDSLSTQ